MSNASLGPYQDPELPPGLAVDNNRDIGDDDGMVVHNTAGQNHLEPHRSPIYCSPLSPKKFKFERSSSNEFGPLHDDYIYNELSQSEQPPLNQT